MVNAKVKAKTIARLCAKAKAKVWARARVKLTSSESKSAGNSHVTIYGKRNCDCKNKC